jgi:hypothetical protein
MAGRARALAGCKAREWCGEFGGWSGRPDARAGAKYVGVVAYCFVNSAFRTLHKNILSAWLVNTVEDEAKRKGGADVALAYEVTAVYTVYTWVDWLLYMSILLSQIDMVLVEVAADLLTSLASTWYYLRLSERQEGREQELARLVTACATGG